MLRITGGQYVRRRLKAPGGLDTRPTADRVKEALFSILGSRVCGAKVLDLFAGSGALGLEAISRGAASCLFVENNHKAIRIIKENIASLDLAAAAKVLASSLKSAQALLVKQGPFDLVLADPPYEQGCVAGIVELASGLLTPDGVMVLEHSPKERPVLPSSLVLSDQRAYGQTKLSFIEPA